MKKLTWLDVLAWVIVLLTAAPLVVFVFIGLVIIAYEHPLLTLTSLAGIAVVCWSVNRVSKRLT